LNANGTALSVIGNNIANLSTVGFKGSRATFADLISSSISGGSGSVQTGIGVALTSVQGDFTQGSLATSSNVLDLAIDGNGFFVMRDAQNGTFYGRNGLFRLNQNSVVVDPTGFKLQGFLADTTGTITGNIGDISLPTTTAAPNPTTTALLAANLNSSTATTGVRGNVVGSAASVTTTAAGNNAFTINLNGDGAQTVTVANGLTGSALASAIQSAVRGLTAANPYLQSAYDGFEATVGASNIFTFRSGISGTTNDAATNTGAVVVAASGANTLAANLNMLAGTSTTGTDFDITDPVGTSNFTTSLTVYDSLGNDHLLTTYFTKVGANTWNYNVVSSTADVNTANYHSSNIDTTLGIVRVGAGTLTFGTDGTLQREGPVIRFDTSTAAGTVGTTAGELQIDFVGATQDQLIDFNFGDSVITDGGNGLTGSVRLDLRAGPTNSGRLRGRLAPGVQRRHERRDQRPVLQRTVARLGAGGPRQVPGSDRIDPDGQKHIRRIRQLRSAGDRLTGQRRSRPRPVQLAGTFERRSWTEFYRYDRSPAWFPGQFPRDHHVG
jgi:flagellar hook protein FlgE